MTDRPAPGRESTPSLRRRAGARAARAAADAARRTARGLRWCGPVLPLGLALFALGQPWAKARVAAVWGLSRSPQAAALVGASLAACVVAAVLVAARARRPRVAALLHAAIGVAMGAVCVAAFRMITDSNVNALWFVPVARVRPALGWNCFAAAAAGFVLLGGIEWWVAERARGRALASAETGEPSRAG